MYLTLFKMQKCLVYCSFYHVSVHSIPRYNVICKAIIYYILPLSIIGVLYVLMARRLHVSARDMPGEIAGPQSRAQARARRHVARMVVTFVIGNQTKIYTKRVSFTHLF